MLIRTDIWMEYFPCYYLISVKNNMNLSIKYQNKGDMKYLHDEER